MDWGGGVGPQMAATLADLGKIRADQTLAQGRIWGDTLANLGNMTGTLIAQAPQRQALEQERQARALELQTLVQQHQQQIQDRAHLDQGRAALSDILSNPSMYDPNTGDPDHGAIAGELQKRGFPEAAQSYIAGAEKQAQFGELLSKAQKDRQAAQRSMDDSIATLIHNASNRAEAVHMLTQVSSGPNPSVDPGTAQHWSQLIANNWTDETFPQEQAHVWGLSTPGRAEAAERAKAAAAGFNLSPGQHHFEPGPTGTPMDVASVPEKTPPLPNSQEAEFELPGVGRVKGSFVPGQNGQPGKYFYGVDATGQPQDVTAKARANTPVSLLPKPETGFGAGPGGAIPGPDVQPGEKNDAFLQTLAPPIAAQVKALAEGRQQFPSGNALRTPYWQNMIQAVAKYDPSFDIVNYNARAKTRADFTSGKSAQQVNAINTVIGHLANLSDAADALQNGDLQTWNSLKNRFKTLTGSQDVTNFNVVRKAVADELTRVWRQAGGSEKDIQENLDNLGSANSPQQLHGAIATFGDLLESKLGSLNEQYRQGMGTDKIDMVTPAARATLTKLEQRAGRGAPGNAPAVASAAPPSGTTKAAPAIGTEGTLNGQHVVWDTRNGKTGWWPK